MIRGEAYKERRERMQLNNGLKRKEKINTCWIKSGRKAVVTQVI